MGEEEEIGGGCQCGCCGDASDGVEMASPTGDRETLLQMRDRGEERLPEIAES